MDSQRILRENQSLKKKVRQLSNEVESLRNSFFEDASSVERMLKMRGIKISRRNPAEGLFFPLDLPLPFEDKFYEMMKKYSFRLVLRDMIKHQNRFRVQDLTHYSSAKTAQAYCHLLCEMGAIVEDGKGGYRTRISPIYSFGPTLEWFVAEMFKREFASPAIYGVSLKQTPSGGDYDVIASWNQRLVYVEVKSSPPKGIESSEVSSFFSRIDDLLPEVAILFNDTQLRMKDKLVVMFEEEMEKRHGRRSRPVYPVERLVGELFHVRYRIFIINSKKDVTENFHTCLNRHLRYGAPLIAPLPKGVKGSD
jgi:hypothetical protein